MYKISKYSLLPSIYEHMTSRSSIIFFPFEVTLSFACLWWRDFIASSLATYTHLIDYVYVYIQCLYDYKDREVFKHYKTYMYIYIYIYVYMYAYI